MAAASDNMILSRETKKEQVQKRNQQHKANMDKGKIIKQELTNLFNEIKEKRSEQYKECVTNIDMVAISKLFFELFRKLKNKTTLIRMAKQFVELIKKDIPRYVSPAGIVSYIVTKYEVTTLPSSINKTFKCKFTIKSNKSDSYQTWQYQIPAYFSNKIPNGCPSTCSCRGLMNNELINLNRCLRCTPFLTFHQLGYTSKCLQSFKIKNYVIEQSKNPPIGICNYCFIDIIDIGENLRKYIQNQSEFALIFKIITELIILFNRSLVKNDIYGNHEPDNAMINHWPSHRQYKGQLDNYGDKYAKKQYKIPHICEYFKKLKAQPDGKVRLFKFTYNIPSHSIMELDDEKDSEEDDDDDDDMTGVPEDDELKADDDNNQQWFENNNKNNGYNSEEEISGEYEDGDFIETKYSMSCANRFWWVYNKSESCGEAVSWDDQSLQDNKKFKQFNQEYLSKCLDSQGNYDPSLDTEFINNAFPCVNFQDSKNKDFKEFLLKTARSTQSLSYHVVVILGQLKDQCLYLNVIDTNEEDTAASNRFSNAFLDKWKKSGNNCWNKSVIKYTHLNINDCNFLKLYQNIIDDRINTGFCDILSNVIVAKLWKFIKKEKSKINNLSFDKLYSYTNSLLEKEIIIPLNKLKNKFNLS